MLSLRDKIKHKINEIRLKMDKNKTRQISSDVKYKYCFADTLKSMPSCRWIVQDKLWLDLMSSSIFIWESLVTSAAVWSKTMTHTHTNLNASHSDVNEVTRYKAKAKARLHKAKARPRPRPRQGQGQGLQHQGQWRQWQA